MAKFEVGQKVIIDYKTTQKDFDNFGISEGIEKFRNITGEIINSEWNFTNRIQAYKIRFPVTRQIWWYKENMLTIHKNLNCLVENP